MARAQRGPEHAAVVAGMVGYAVMNLLMTATPLAMMCFDFSFDATASVIQWHVVAMFAPSFFTGALIRRVGVVAVIQAGGLLTLAGIAVGVSGQGLGEFQLGLVALGVGWNFLYVGATVLLGERCRDGEKVLFQAVNDSVLFLAVAAVTLASAGLVDSLGWATLNLVAAVPILVVAGLAVVVAGPGAPLRRRPPAPEPSRTPP